jgi:hypothetical protein
LFFGVELFERVKTMRAVVIAAFVNNNIETGFPAVKPSVAMGTVIFGFGSSLGTIIDLKDRRADFAKQL